ncbi:MAG: OmpA family protein [bacterium]|nr:OmpA family protein [bacterium]
MKRIMLYLGVVAFIITCSVQLFADSKSDAKVELGEARRQYKHIKKQKKLHPYVSFANYSRGVTLLEKARIQFEEEREYDLASYFAVLARVEFETAVTIARGRLLEHKSLLFERDYFKKAYQDEKLKGYFISSNLEKTGKAYKGYLVDSRLFVRKTFNLSRDAQKRILDKLYRVLKLYPRSKVIIKGHTAGYDRNNVKSTRKASVVGEYLITVKGVHSSRITTKGLGSSQPVRKRKIDRVEIIITGVTD